MQACTHRLRAGTVLVEDICYDLAEVGCWLLLLGSCCCCTGRPGLLRGFASLRMDGCMGAAAGVVASHPRAMSPLQHLAATPPVAGAGSDPLCYLNTTKTSAYD